MFEKEAEERTKQYMNEHTEKYNCENTKLETDNYNMGREQGYEDGFKDGAEFGYNKAKEELKINKDDIRKAKLNSFEMFEEKNEYLREVSNWAIFNEDIRVMFWCFVQRGYIYAEQLNKANEWHYVKDGDLPKENKKYLILTSSREPKVDSWLNISWVNSYDVIAWKEIVLPEFQKESDYV